MKKSTDKLIIIPSTIYPCNVYVFLGCKPKFIVEQVGKFYPDYDKDFSSEEVFEGNIAYTIGYPDGSVLIHIDKDRSNNIGIIAHEAFHATEFIMSFIGLPHSEDSSEAFAYLLQYLVTKITE